MKTQTRLIATAALIASSLLPLTTAHAAPKIDPRLIGHWRGTVLVIPTGTARLVMDFKPDGTETQTDTAPGHSLIVYGTYAASGDTLAQNLVRATRDGHPMRYHCTCSVKYKVSGSTLTLGQANASVPCVLHRIKP